MECIEPVYEQLVRELLAQEIQSKNAKNLKICPSSHPYLTLRQGTKDPCCAKKPLPLDLPPLEPAEVKVKTEVKVKNELPAQPLRRSRRTIRVKKEPGVFTEQEIDFSDSDEDVQEIIVVDDEFIPDFEEEEEDIPEEDEEFEEDDGETLDEIENNLIDIRETISQHMLPKTLEKTISALAKTILESRDMPDPYPSFVDAFVTALKVPQLEKNEGALGLLRDVYDLTLQHLEETKPPRTPEVLKLLALGTTITRLTTIHDPELDPLSEAKATIDGVIKEIAEIESTLTDPTIGDFSKKELEFKSIIDDLKEARTALINTSKRVSIGRKEEELERAKEMFNRAELTGTRQKLQLETEGPKFEDDIASLEKHLSQFETALDVFAAAATEEIEERKQAEEEKAERKAIQKEKRAAREAKREIAEAKKLQQETQESERQELQESLFGSGAFDLEEFDLAVTADEADSEEEERTVKKRRTYLLDAFPALCLS